MADTLPQGPYDRWVPRERQIVYESEANCFHPQLVRTAQGHLLLSMLRGDPPSTVVLRSTDNGRSWLPPELVADAFEWEGGGGWGLAVLGSGRIVMSYLDIRPWPKLPISPPASEAHKMHRWPAKGLSPWAWTPAVTRSALRILLSDDEGYTWKLGEPISLAPWIAAIPHGSGPIFEANGSVYMPVWAWRSEEACHDCALLVSRDGAATWSPGPVIAHGNEASGLQYRETAVHVLPSGRWLAICRANQPNYHGAVNVTTHGAVSGDGGQTWSLPFPYLAALGYPRLMSMPDGALAAMGTTGEVIRALFSHSEGDSWDAEEVVYLRDGRESLGLLDCGSASAAAIDDDQVLVVYYATRDQRHDFSTRIRLVNRIESVWLQRFAGDAAEVMGR